MRAELAIAERAMRRIVAGYPRDGVPPLRNLDFGREGDRLHLLLGDGHRPSIHLSPSTRFMPEFERRDLRSACRRAYVQACQVHQGGPTALDICNTALDQIGAPAVERRPIGVLPWLDAELLRVQFAQQREIWRHEAMNDPAIGGERLQTNMHRIHRLLGDCFTAGERQNLLRFFSDTGLGDHPELLRFLLRLAEGGPLRDEVRDQARELILAAIREVANGGTLPAERHARSIWLCSWGEQTSEAYGISPAMPAIRELAQLDTMARVQQQMADALMYGVAVAMPGAEQSRVQAEQERVAQQHVRTSLPQGAWSTLHAGEPIVDAVDDEPYRYIDASRDTLRYYELVTGLRHSKEAEANGEKLLREWLSPAQLKQYDENKSFEVIGSKTRTRYRITHGTQINIDELDAGGAVVQNLCFVPQGHLVAGDVMLAQKIALETDERAALKIANRFQPNRFGPNIFPCRVEYVRPGTMVLDPARSPDETIMQFRGIPVRVVDELLTSTDNS